ncbi:MAG: 16S rRNA (adenine(1518)-N(6)/adenine(1519)-N(6))-dimethyltransferase RsmA [Ruminococcaceae bacterium]|nr:16S rRNA (adenine(1518)-N(6)/adenine(1519)-N(6))-dimethyltransferase RsmA [Oscillospiraceae bacterium]
MYQLWDIHDIKYILKKHGFAFSKALGQNFIVDAAVCPAIVEGAAIGAEDYVLEIGPGIGVLSAELCKSAKKVVAVELDKRLPDILADTLADFDNFELVEGDILKLDLHTLWQEHFAGAENLKICANLPYYITSPVIMRFLESDLPIESITVMVQKEAGERICAQPGSKQAGAVTVAVQYYASAEELFFVPKEAFLPSPKVDSEVIQLTVREQPPIAPVDENLFFKVVKAAFLQRRKAAANSLSAGLAMPKAEVIAMLEALGFAPDCRAENFSMEDFAAITAYLAKSEEK